MADVFEDRPDLVEPRARLFALIAETPWLDWLLLTKRPENVMSCLGDDDSGVFGFARNSGLSSIPGTLGWNVVEFVGSWINGEAPPNVWIGTTVEDQARAEERIGPLLAIPATVRFLSCEPLLEEVDLRLGDPTIHARQPQIHWVICGGESGPGARPMHPEWARSLRDQCEIGGVPFFFKQWGDWVYPQYADPAGAFEDFPRKKRREVWTPRGEKGCLGYDVLNLGKRGAGRRLDGEAWEQLPRLGLEPANRNQTCKKP